MDMIERLNQMHMGKEVLPLLTVDSQAVVEVVEIVDIPVDMVLMVW
tara:strand:- start:124 stop:261 length:138 start_codon:yes stop_codon:yes gene_type:complete